MTETPHFWVDLDQIRTHATTVGQFADDLAGNTGAHGGTLSDNALGSFVQFLTLGLQNAMTSTSQAIGHASTAMHDVRAGLVNTADRYHGSDTDNATMLNEEGSQ